MKTEMKIIAGLFLMSIAAAGGCTRQELDIVSRAPEFNEQSKDYQQYLYERAVSYIKGYQFGKVDEVKNRIVDEALRRAIDSVYRVYRQRATNEALYYARPDGDTLFFVVPSSVQPDRLTRTHMYINPRSDDNDPEPLSRGILSGFGNYPALEAVTIYAFADEYRELDRLPRLKSIALGVGDSELFEATNPGQKAPVMPPVTADFSANHKLEKVTLTDINIDHFTFPDHSIGSVSLNGANTDSPAIAGLKADLLDVLLLNVRGSEFVVENPHIKALRMRSKQVETNEPLARVDISRSKLKKLELYFQVKELLLNDGLEYIYFSTKKMETPPELPVTLREAVLRWYHPAPDLSRLTNLESLSFETDPFPQGLIWPPNLVQLKTENASGTIDLSGLVRMKRMRIYEMSDRLDEIIFPPNLVESEMNDPETSFYSRLYISRSCKLTGKPDWLDRFITYRD